MRSSSHPKYAGGKACSLKCGASGPIGRNRPTAVMASVISNSGLAARLFDEQDQRRADQVHHQGLRQHAEHEPPDWNKVWSAAVVAPNTFAISAKTRPVEHRTDRAETP